MTDTPNHMKLRAIFVGGPLHLKRFPVNEPIAFEIESILQSTGDVLMLGRAALPNKVTYRPMDENSIWPVGLWKTVLGVDVIYTTSGRMGRDDAEFHELIVGCLRSQMPRVGYIQPKHYVPEDIVIPFTLKEENV